jgi:hypothetical protein
MLPRARWQAMLMINLACLILYALEIVGKLLAYGVQEYFRRSPVTPRSSRIPTAAQNSRRLANMSLHTIPCPRGACLLGPLVS